MGEIPHFPKSQSSGKADKDGTQETARSLYREATRAAYTAKAVDRLWGSQGTNSLGLRPSLW